MLHQIGDGTAQSNVIFCKEDHQIFGVCYFLAWNSSASDMW